jgi:ectoine hydroxylase-related dioxygenase (phytanoyl-CoA dioxygenase family)
MAYDESFVPLRMNPDLTLEMEREVRFFMKWGYLVVENAISPEQVESLRAALDESFARNNVQFIHQLLEEDDRFGFLLDNPPVFTRMKAILGNCVQLHSATARVTKPGEIDQDWHRDGPWPMDPDGTPYGSIPGQINCGYYLDELTMENGPIVVVPGSHRAAFKPLLGHPTFPDEKFILAKPGQAIMFNGWLFHRGAANNSANHRRACMMCYQNAWMKSREPFNGPKVTKMRENGSNEIKLLLGAMSEW